MTRDYADANVYVDTLYDTNGRAGHVSKPYHAGSTQNWTYYRYDNARIDRDATRVTTVTVHTQGQTTSVVDANSRTTTYEYEPFGLWGSVTVGGNKIMCRYDNSGNLHCQADPGMGTW